MPLNTHTAELHRVLDDCTRHITDGASPPRQPIVAPLAQALTDYRNAVPPDHWSETVVPELRGHPLFRLLLEDPYSSYGFRKPRGYPGDAVLLDFIYGGGASTPFVEAATPLGVALYRECASLSSFAAIQDRRDYLSSRLVELSEADPAGAHILSVACGHLREAQPLLNLPLAGRFVALDQDPETLEVVRNRYHTLNIETVQASVLNLIRSGDGLGKFDFIYSAGLYDYLSDEVAVRLLAKLLKMLKPGGRLLIANMVPDFPGVGYMEAVMDWWLIYRTASQMIAIVDRLGASRPPMSILTYTRLYVVYLEIAV